jgi:hypothetical protein
MTHSKPAPKTRLIFSLILGAATLGTTLVTTTEQASALPLVNGLIAPLGSLLGIQQRRPPTPNDTQVMNGNLNNNSLNLCALTCGPSAGASGLPGAPTGGRPPGFPGVPQMGIPNGQMISGGQMPPGRPMYSGGQAPGGQMTPGGQMPPGGQMIPGRSPYPVPPQAQRSANPILQLPPIQLPNPF